MKYAYSLKEKHILSNLFFFPVRNCIHVDRDRGGPLSLIYLSIYLSIQAHFDLSGLISKAGKQSAQSYENCLSTARIRTWAFHYFSMYLLIYLSVNYFDFFIYQSINLCIYLSILTIVYLGRLFCKALFKALGLDDNDFKFGLTKVKYSYLFI